jgi:RHS repeat-associated protein
MSKKRISQYIALMLCVQGGLIAPTYCMASGIERLPDVPVWGVSPGSWVPGPILGPSNDPGSDYNDGGSGDSGGGFEGNPGENEAVKDASQGDGCGGSNPTHDTSNPAHANPIVLSTGNKIEPEMDFTSTGELPLQLTRTYNHYWKYPGLFGKYWVSSLDYTLVIASDESIIFAQRPDGRRIKFIKDTVVANHWLEDKANPVASIYKVGGQFFQLRTEDEFSETYDSSGRVMRRSNSNGIAWVFLYENNYLTTVRHSSGRLNGSSLDRSMTLHWTGNKLTSITAPDGSEFNYTYTADAFGVGMHRLASTVSPNATDNPAVTTTYQYEDARFPGGLTGKLFNGARYSTFTYDANGRATLSEHAGPSAGTYVDAYQFSYDGAPVAPPADGPPDPPAPGVQCDLVTHRCPRPQFAPDPETSAASLADAEDKAAAEDAMISMIPATTTTVWETNPLGIQTKYTFLDGKLSTVSGLASAHCSARSSSRSYDSNGYDDLVTDFRGYMTDYNYAANGQLTNVVEASGTADARTTAYTWDTVRNRPLTITVNGLSQTTFTYSPENRIASVAVKNLTSNGTANQTHTWTNQYTRWGVASALKTMVSTSPLSTDSITTSYSEDGDLLTVTRTIGGATYTTTYSGYDGLGHPGSVVGPNGDRVDFAYYPGGKLKSVTTYPDGATAATATTKYLNGLVNSSTGPDGVTTTYAYDNARRLKTESRPIIGGTATRTYTYDAGSNATRVDVDLGGTLAFRAYTDYDELGRVIARRGNHSENSSYTYDVNGNLATTKDSNGKITTLEYDGLNRLKKSTDPDSYFTQIEHDKADRVSKVTDPRSKVTTYGYDGFGQLWNEVSPDRGTTSYIYLASGLLDTMTRANGVQSKYVYDDWGRVTSITASGQSETFGYDTCTNGVGRLCSTTAPTSSFSYTYEKDGRMRSRSDTITVGGSTSTSAANYTYDAVGRRYTLSYPNGEKLTYAYSSGQPSSMTITMGGVVKNVVSGANYEPFGALSGYTHGNGLVRDLVFDLDGRYSSITSKNGTASLQSLGYGYDLNDRITTITNNVTPAWGENYGYDALSRLTTANGTLYTYDANGNRLTKTPPGATYSYTVGNRMTGASNVFDVPAVPDSTGTLDYTTSLTYDGAGNTTSWDFPSVSYKAFYDYDSFNRMYRTRATSGSTTSTLGIYGYNAYGERTNKQDVSNSHNYEYIYSGGHALIAERQDSSQWTNYIWFGGELVGMTRGGALYQIDNDHLGRPELITDNNKAIAWRSNNDAFGEQRTTSTSGLLSGSFHVGLPGQYFDKETNNWYNMNRYYVAELGRYLQADPIGLAGGTNPYIYVNDNPALNVDVLGLMEGIGPWSSPIGYLPDIPTFPTGPDYYSVSASYYIGSGAISFSRSGNVFTSGGISRGYPSAVRGLGISVNMGVLVSACPNSDERADMADKFLSGLSYSATAYDLVGGGVDISPGSGVAILVGLGAGVDVSPGSVGSQTSWSTPQW